MRDDLRKIVKKKNLKIDEILDNKNLRRAFFNDRSLMFGFINSDLTFFKVSKSMADCIGYEIEELEGKSILEFAPLQQIQKDSNLYKYMLEKKETSYYLHPATYIGKNGKEIQVQCLEPVYLEDVDLWMINSYEIDAKSKGITVLTDNFQNFLNDKN